MQYTTDQTFNTSLGFSLYTSNNLADSKQWIRDYQKAGFSFAFTSLNLLEETDQSNKIRPLLQECQEHSIHTFVDINRQVLDSFGIDGLKKLGIVALRIDDGITDSEVVILSNHFKIVLNASTLTSQKISRLKIQGLKTSQLIACHNYYPKPYTGLSLHKVKQFNQQLHQYNIPVVAFIPGEIKRLPIFEGLPTIEEHRHIKPLQAALECLVAAECDYISIGDNTLSASSLSKFSFLAKEVIPLEASVPSPLYHMIFENRLDSSDYVIRAAYSRQQLKQFKLSGSIQQRHLGDIVIANEKFLRYEKELEICLCNLPVDERQTIIGKVRNEDLALLHYVQSPFKFSFVKLNVK